MKFHMLIVKTGGGWNIYLKRKEAQYESLQQRLAEICDTLTDRRKANCKQIKIEIAPTTILAFAMIYPTGLIRLETVSFIELNDEVLKSIIAHEVGHAISGIYMFGGKKTALNFFYLVAKLRVKLGLARDENKYLERADLVARINALRSP